MDLSGWYGPDRKKWFGPNITDSYVFDYLTPEYPGDYGWDSAGPAAGPKTYGPARWLHHHLQSRLVPRACCFVSWLRQCCPPRHCACLLQCYCSAMPCPLPPANKRTSVRRRC